MCACAGVSVCACACVCVRAVGVDIKKKLESGDECGDADFADCALSQYVYMKTSFSNAA